MSTSLLRRFKAALIDMDGVLYDSMPGHTLAWKRMMDDLGVKCTLEEFYLYEGMTGVATIDMLLHRELGHGCTPDEARDLYAVKSRYFQEWGAPALMPGASAMLSALGEAGLRRVLVTGSGQKSLLGTLDRDYPGIFDEGMRITANDVTHGKPDPEPYLKGAERAGVTPAEALVIENAPLGVRAGKAAGCFTIAVTTGPIPRHEFEREGADMIFDSMPAFADFLAFQLRMDRISDSIKPDMILALTDTNVLERSGMDFSFADDVLALDGARGKKDIDALCGVWRWLASKGATRRSLLVNVGGGTVSDLGGLAATTYKRGIDYVNVPTTLLAVADASIGGKTAVNFDGVKNLIGAFAMPRDVIVLPSLLDSLPHEEMVSGFAEVVKMALLTDNGIYGRLAERDAMTDRGLLTDAMRHAADSKKDIVALDPKESGLRRILNLGHTAGHAFEAYAEAIGHKVSHGEAVAHGLRVALRLSAEMVGFPREEADRYDRAFINRYYGQLPVGTEAIDRLIELMRLDKKNPSADVISFVLLRDIGVPVEAVPVDIPLLRNALAETL